MEEYRQLLAKKKEENLPSYNFNVIDNTGQLKCLRDSINAKLKKKIWVKDNPQYTIEISSEPPAEPVCDNRRATGCDNYYKQSLLTIKFAGINSITGISLPKTRKYKDPTDAENEYRNNYCKTANDSSERIYHEIKQLILNR